MTVNLLLNNWPVMLGLLLVGLLVYWLVDEYESEKDAAETVGSVGERADKATGEFLGAVGALVFSVAMIATTIGNQLAETAGMLEPMLAQAPVIIGHIVIAAVGILSLDGVLNLSATEYGYVVILVTIVALFIRFRGNPA